MKTFAIERAQPNIFDWQSSWNQTTLARPGSYTDLGDYCRASIKVRRELSQHTIWFGAFIQEANQKAYIKYYLQFLKDAVEIGRIEFLNGFWSDAWGAVGPAPARILSFYKKDTTDVREVKADGAAQMPNLYLFVPQVTATLPIATIVPWRFNILCTDIVLQGTEYGNQEASGTATFHYGLTVFSQAENF